MAVSVLRGTRLLSEMQEYARLMQLAEAYRLKHQSLDRILAVAETNRNWFQLRCIVESEIEEAMIETTGLALINRNEAALSRQLDHQHSAFGTPGDTEHS